MYIFLDNCAFVGYNKKLKKMLVITLRGSVGSNGHQAHFVTVRSLPRLATKNYSDFYLVASIRF
jgi:hypothetical protein